MLKILSARIQSQSYRPRTQPVDTLVLHHTALDLGDSLQVLRQGAVSAHYVLAEDGTAYRILENHEVAFHAGFSCWRGRPAVNERSIGIEIVNRDGNRHAYPPAQVEALTALCRRVLAENPAIDPGNVVGHSDIAPRRKVDPGGRFPWREIARAGIGLWPEGAIPGEVGAVEEIQALLERCGYPAPHAYGLRGGAVVAVADPDRPPADVAQVVRVGTSEILAAFQLHYQPDRSGKGADGETMGLLRRRAAMS